jgi:hypothetical protein
MGAVGAARVELIFLPDCTARVNDEVMARISKSIEFLMIVFQMWILRQLLAKGFIYKRWGLKQVRNCSQVPGSHQYSTATERTDVTLNKAIVDNST